VLVEERWRRREALRPLRCAASTRASPLLGVAGACRAGTGNRLPTWRPDYLEFLQATLAGLLGERTPPPVVWEREAVARVRIALRRRVPAGA
jgi:hypothetical protein